MVYLSYFDAHQMSEVDVIIAEVVRAYQEANAVVFNSLWRMSKTGSKAMCQDRQLVGVLLDQLRSTRNALVIEPVIGIFANMFCAEEAVTLFGQQIVESFDEMMSSDDPSLNAVIITMLRNMFFNHEICATAARCESFVDTFVGFLDRVCDTPALVAQTLNLVDVMRSIADPHPQFRRIMEHSMITNRR